MSLKSFANEKKILQDNLNLDTLWISSENLLSLSGTESGYEVLENFNKDLNKNTSVISAIVNLLLHPNEMVGEDVDIKDLPIVKSGILDKYTKTNFAYLKDEIKKDILVDYFSNKEHNIGQKDLTEYINFIIAAKPQELKRIYDVSDVYEYVKYANFKNLADNIAENILEINFIKSNLLKDNDKFDAYDKIYNSKIATTYTEKKDSTILYKEDTTYSIQQNNKNLNIDKEFIELLNNNKYIHAIEIDEQTDIEKLKLFLKEMNEFNFKVDESVYLKIRLLGKHKASGLYYSGYNIVAVDLFNEYSLIHEMTHHIDLTNPAKNRNEIFFYFNQFNDYSHLNENKLFYFSNPKEVIARAGEVSFSLYKADFYNLYEAYINQKDYKGQKVTEENFKEILFGNDSESAINQPLSYFTRHSRVYFDIEERSIEELAMMYNYFGNIFNYEHQIDMQNIKENLSKVQNLDFSVKLRNRKFRRRNRVTGLKSYNFDTISSILNFFNENYINIISKEEFLYNVMISEDISSKTHLNLMKELKSDSTTLLNKEEKSLVINNLLDFLINEDFDKSIFNIAKNYIDIIPSELLFNLNILSVENISQINETNILNYYIYDKENILHIKQPREEDNYSNKDILNFYNKLSFISDIGKMVENNYVPFKFDFTQDKKTGNLDINRLGKQQIYITDKNNNLIFPFEEDFYELNTSLNFNNVGYKFVEGKFDNSKESYFETNQNIIDSMKSNYDRKNYNCLLSYEKKGDRTDLYLGVWERHYTEREIENNHFMYKGKPEQELLFHSKLPSSYSSADRFRINVDEKTGEKELYKLYHDSNLTHYFGITKEVAENFVKNSTKVEEIISLLKFLGNCSGGANYSKLINEQTFIAPIFEKYGTEGMKKFFSNLFSDFFKHNIQHILNFSSEEHLNNMLDFFNVKSNLNTSYFNLLIPGLGFDNTLSLESKMNNFSIITNSFFEQYDFIFTEIAKKIKDKNIPLDYDRLFTSIEGFQGHLKKEMITIFNNIYSFMKDNIVQEINTETVEIWEKICNEKEVGMSSKISIKEVCEVFNKIDFDYDSLENVKKDFIEANQNSKRAIDYNMFKNLFLNHFNTNLHPMIDLGNKNILDFADNLPQYNRKSTEAIKDDSIINSIYKNTSFEDLSDMSNSLIKINKTKDRYSYYSFGFNLLQSSISYILTKKENFNRIERKHTNKDTKILADFADYIFSDTEEKENNVIDTVEKEISDEQIAYIFEKISSIETSDIAETYSKKRNLFQSTKYKKEILELIEGKINNLSFDNQTVENYLNNELSHKNILSLQSMISKSKFQKETSYRRSNEAVSDYMEYLKYLRLESIVSKIFKSKDKSKSNKNTMEM